MDPDPQQLSHLILYVQKNGKFRRILFQESGDRFPAFFRVDTENDKIFGLVLALQLLQGRSLLPAVGSPRCPEVEEDYFPFILLNLDRFPLKVLQRKIRKGQELRIGLKSARPPALGPSRVPPRHSQKKKRSQPCNYPGHRAFGAHSSPILLWRRMNPFFITYEYLSHKNFHPSR